MQIDRKAIERLLSLSDKQLRAVLDTLSGEYGLDLSFLQLKEGSMAQLRQAVRELSDDELSRIAGRLKGGNP